MCLMGQEVKQEKGLTQDRRVKKFYGYTLKAKEKGILKQSVMEAEKPVDAVLTQELDGVPLCGSLVVMNAGREMNWKFA